jgi:hypothetical protein
LWFHDFLLVETLSRIESYILSAGPLSRKRHFGARPGLSRLPVRINSEKSPHV